MNVKDGNSGNTWTDDDDAPELDSEWLKAAHVYDNDVLVKRGEGAAPGVDATCDPALPDDGPDQVSLEVAYDRDLVEAFKATGPGWQVRMNKALRRFLVEHDVEELDGD